MLLIADVFPKLQTLENVVKEMSKKCRITGLLKSNMVRGTKHCWNLNHTPFYHIYCSLWRQLSWRKSLLVICKFLSMFVNILTADDKYYLLNRNNLRQPIQMQLSQRKETFPELISSFLKTVLNFEHFQKKMTLIADVFPKLQTPKNVVKQIL